MVRRVPEEERRHLGQHGLGPLLSGQVDGAQLAKGGLIDVAPVTARTPITENGEAVGMAGEDPEPERIPMHGVGPTQLGVHRIGVLHPRRVVGVPYEGPGRGRLVADGPRRLAELGGALGHELGDIRVGSGAGCRARHGSTVLMGPGLVRLEGQAPFTEFGGLPTVGLVAASSAGSSAARRRARLGTAGRGRGAMAATGPAGAGGVPTPPRHRRAGPAAGRRPVPVGGGPGSRCVTWRRSRRTSSPTCAARSRR